jgi:hypothetical protein
MVAHIHQPHDNEKIKIGESWSKLAGEQDPISKITRAKRTEGMRYAWLK